MKTNRLFFVLFVLFVANAPAQTVVRLNSNSIIGADAFTATNANNTITGINTNATGAFNWARVSKTGSSLADLTTRSAGDLTSGTLDNARLDAELAAFAGLTSAADKLPYFTGSGTAAVTTFTAAGRALVDDADAAAQRTTLGLGIGTDVQAYNTALTASTFHRLRNVWNKLAQQGAGTATPLVLMDVGDSLGFSVLKYIGPQLRAQFGDAGFIGLAGVNAVCFPTLDGGATVTTGTDHTYSPTGSYATLAGSGDGVRFSMGTQSPSVYPYATAINSFGSLTANTIKIYYAQENGAGTFKVQSTANGTDWVDVSGLTAVNAAGSTALGIASATISPATIQGVRAVWVSGAVKIIAGGAYNTAAAGVIHVSLSRGAMLTNNFATAAFTPALLADLPAPQLVTWCGRNDGAAGINASLTNLESVFSGFTTTDFIYTAVPEASADGPGVAAAYNAIVQTHAATAGALYLDTMKYLGSYTEANARGWMTDTVHPNDRGWSFMADVLKAFSGLDNLSYGHDWRPINSSLPATVGALTSASTTASGATTAAQLKATGTGGAGYFEVPYQSGSPSTPTSAGRVYFDASGNLCFQNASGVITTFAPTGTRTLTLQNTSGTVAYINNQFNDTTNTVFKFWNANTTTVPTLGIGHSTARQFAITAYGSTATAYGSIPLDYSLLYSNYPNGIGILSETGPIDFWIGSANRIGRLTSTGFSMAGFMVSTSATLGVGYATGAGGTVTQTTNRTTGVTINKVTGTITTDTTSLAAGAYASFTVTNSAVAISDLPDVSIRSGATNKKTHVKVTAIAAGSFEITVFNDDPSTAEVGAIVINFAVIKGVTS